MKVGLVKEIKRHEYRVGLTPSCVSAYVQAGHEVLVEKDAGLGTGFSNDEYVNAGGKIIETKKEVYDTAEMVVKVKEPIPEEYDMIRKDQILYCYLHLAADKPLTEKLMAKGATGVAFETITDNHGSLCCLTPMSEIAGRLSTQEGAKFLERPFGGRGVLLGGVPGVRRGKVTIIGGGVVGTNACQMAVGLGADVTILDINGRRLAYLDDIFGNRITTLYSTRAQILECLKESDLVIGALLIPGAAAPHVILKEDLKLMKEGAVIVDVAVDQGGCCETTHATTHDEPTYVVDGVVHYCVANMPGAVPRTSTLALTSTTLQIGLEIANKGIEKAAADNVHILHGINTYAGNCVYKEVAEALSIPYTAYQA